MVVGVVVWELHVAQPLVHLRVLTVGPFAAAACVAVVFGVGQFGTGKLTRAHALWAGARPNPALEHLQRKVDTAIRRVGTAQEAHKFTPHVTVARMRNPEPGKVMEWLTHHALYTSAEFEVGAFHLYSSVLTSDGSSYRIERDYELGV